MDRRDFLKIGGAAAVTGGAAGSVAADTVPAPSIKSGVRHLALANACPADLPGLGPERLARKLEIAMGGELAIVEATDAGDADLTYGRGLDSVQLHPAFAFFSGLPLGQALDAQDLLGWLALGGGQILWDELAASFGFKALPVGHSGPSAGLWANRRLERLSDLRGAMVGVSGPAADVVRAIGGQPVTIAPRDLKAALAGGRIAAAEWLGPPLAIATSMQPLAERLYTPGLYPAGEVLVLNVRRDLWVELSDAERAVFTACAAEECQLAVAEARTAALVVAQISRSGKWPVRQEFEPELGAALERAAADTVNRIAAVDDRAARIHDSYAAFRALHLDRPIA